MNEKKQFTIQRMDPLGQGVSLDHERVTFIPKTLPGEIVEATISEIKGKKVQFAKLDEVISASEKRETSPCPHFDICQGCSYLHTDYQTEVENKHAAYSWLYRKYIDPDKISFHQASERLGYRNRIQVHYEVRGRKERVGFQNDEGIHAIPSCLLPHPQIQDLLRENYQNDIWNQKVPDNAPTGHLELYKKGEEVQITANKPYSDGGFSQVNQEMAKKARDLIQEIVVKEGTETSTIFDLFGGKGFLTNGLKNATAVIDFGAKPSWKNTKERFYIDQNLFKKKAIQKLKTSLASFLGKGNERILIVDPPRSGVKNLDEFVEFLKPQMIIYLSCNPHTQVRDIDPLLNSGNWEVNDGHFFDFFPATHHLESLMVLTQSN